MLVSDCPGATETRNTNKVRIPDGTPANWRVKQVRRLTTDLTTPFCGGIMHFKLSVFIIKAQILTVYNKYIHI